MTRNERIGALAVVSFSLLLILLGWWWRTRASATPPPTVSPLPSAQYPSAGTPADKAKAGDTSDVSPDSDSITHSTARGTDGKASPRKKTRKGGAASGKKPAASPPARSPLDEPVKELPPEEP